MVKPPKVLPALAAVPGVAYLAISLVVIAALGCRIGAEYSFNVNEGWNAYWARAAWTGAATSFNPGSGAITFAPGQTVATISFTVNPTSVSGCSMQSIELGLPCYPDAGVTLSNPSHATLEPSPEVGLVYLPSG